MYKFSKVKFWLVVISGICLVWGLIINPIRNNWDLIWHRDADGCLSPGSLLLLFVMIFVAIGGLGIIIWIFSHPECCHEYCKFYDNGHCNLFIHIKRLFNSEEMDGVNIPTIKRLLFFTKVKPDIKQNNTKYHTNDSCTNCANCMIKNNCKKNPNNPDNLDPIDREVDEMVRKIFID